MNSSCGQWSQPLNSLDEISDIQGSIFAAAAETGVDQRFILAVIASLTRTCSLWEMNWLTGSDARVQRLRPRSNDLFQYLQSGSDAVFQWPRVLQQ